MGDLTVSVNTSGRSNIAFVQVALVRAGPLDGATYINEDRLFSGSRPALGVLDSSTASAIEVYQNNHNLPKTGDIDQHFVEHLNKRFAPTPAPSSGGSGDLQPLIGDLKRLKSELELLSSANLRDSTGDELRKKLEDYNREVVGVVKTRFGI